MDTSRVCGPAATDGDSLPRLSAIAVTIARTMTAMIPTRIRLRDFCCLRARITARLRDDIGELLSSNALPRGSEHHRDGDGSEGRTGHVRNGCDAELAHPDDRTWVVHVAGTGFERR